jgi:hypothetical protein
MIPNLVIGHGFRYYFLKLALIFLEYKVLAIPIEEE